MVRLECGGYSLDLPLDFGIQINKSVADVKEMSNRNSDWTQSFKLPGSKVNRKAFTHLFELQYSIQNTSSTNFNPDYNPNLKAPATLYVDEVKQIAGFIRLNNIVILDSHSIEFECTLYGQLADLFTTLGDSTLDELDFSEWNHILSTTNIFESWDTRVQKNGANYVNFSAGNPTGEGYVYGLIDDGNLPSYSNVRAENFTPLLYEKTIVDKIFSTAGYSYTSDSWFNEAEFKKKVTPCPQGRPIISDADAADRLFEASRTGSNQTMVTGDVCNFQTEAFDYSNQYASGVFTNAFNGATYDLYFYLSFEISGLAFSRYHSVAFNVLVNGVTAGVVTAFGTTNGAGLLTVANTFIVSNIFLNSTDTVRLAYSGTVLDINSGTPSIVSPSPTLTLKTTSKFYNGVVGSWGLGQEVAMSSFFQTGVKQKDFIKGLILLYNLYCEPDPDFPTKIALIPRDDFYHDTVQDWTLKLDLSKDFVITPMGELTGNPFNFTYSEGEDVENKDYQAAYDRIYGDLKYSINNDFINQEIKIELPFAPTQLFTQQTKTLSYIDNGKGANGKLRTLIYGGLKTCNSYRVYDTTTTYTTKTSYPFVAHIDDPTTPTLDLLFGNPKRINLPAGTAYTSNNQFNRFWYRHIEEITDKNSKIVTGYFQITPADIEKLSFRDLYFFENNYFRLNKIENYNPMIPDTFKCEFLMLKTVPAFVGTSTDVGTGDLLGGIIRTNNIQVGTFGNNPTRKQNIFTGSDISSDGTTQGAAALGSKNVRFIGADRSVAILCDDFEIKEPDKIAIQNLYWDMSGVSNGEVPVYNSTTNTFEPGSPSAAAPAPVVYSKTFADSPFTLTDTSGQVMILVDCTGGNVTINLPTAVGNTSVVSIKKTDSSSNSLTVDPNGVQTIDGLSTYVTAIQYDPLTIFSDNSNWFKI